MKSQFFPAARLPPSFGGGGRMVAKKLVQKADGDAPVQAHIAAMPGWKQHVGRRLDALVARSVPAIPIH
jgi:hypothetical protein